MGFTFPEQQRCQLWASNLNARISTKLRVLLALLNVASSEHFFVAVLPEIDNAHPCFPMTRAGGKVTETAVHHQRIFPVYRKGNVIANFYSPLYTTGAIYPSIR
jgi:hypothetical protein